MIVTLQKTWIKPLYSYTFISRSLYECFDVSTFWVNRLSMEVQKLLRFGLISSFVWVWTNMRLNNWQEFSFGDLRPLHTEYYIFSRNLCMLKNKYDLTSCQSHLHTASETFIRHTFFWIRLDFRCFPIRSIYFDRKGWRIRKNGKPHAKISN